MTIQKYNIRGFPMAIANPLGRRERIIVAIIGRRATVKFGCFRLKSKPKTASCSKRDRVHFSEPLGVLVRRLG